MKNKIIGTVSVLILFNLSVCFAGGVLDTGFFAEKRQLIGWGLLIIFILVMACIMGYSKYLLGIIVVLAIIGAIFMALVHYVGTSMQTMNPPEGATTYIDKDGNIVVKEEEYYEW